METIIIKTVLDLLLIVIACAGITTLVVAIKETDYSEDELE